MSFIKTKFILAAMVVLAVLALVFVIRNTGTISTGGVIVDAGNDDTVTREELAKHNSLEDCWVSYNGKVYDLTSFLPGHPGRPERIVPYCGTAEEFQTAFEKKHGTSKVELLMQVGTFMGDLQVVGNLNLN